MELIKLNKMNKIVKSVNYVKPISSQWGEFHKWNLEFEDGFSGEYLSKSEQQNKFIVGQSVDIEVTKREYNGETINKIKPASNFQGGGNKPQLKADNVQELIVKQNALTNACNIVGVDDVPKILEIADAFKEWVLNDVKPQKTKSNDLPF